MDSKVVVFVVGMILLCSLSSVNGEEWPSPVVTRESRRTLVLTESGRITAVDVHDGYGGSYHLQFITLEPVSLFLPVLLHTDMVFYVHTGRGTVTYVNEDKDETDEMDVGHGDVYRLEQGTVFFVRSHPDPTREKLRIHAIFDTAGIDHPLGCAVRAYSNISDLVQGFDERVLQMGFGASLESIRGIKWAPSPPSIVPFGQKDARVQSKWKEGVFEALMGVRGPTGIINKKKTTKSKTFNFFRAKPDVENCNGWSTAVTHKDLKALKGSNLAAFMVNLATGSMMGPHWNPRATEIATVIQGQGMVQVICPSDPSGKVGDVSKCQNKKFKVQEGDVFVVPRFHPMAQVSYNNDTLVFVGFSSMAGKNHPQFLAGKRSVLRTIDRDVLAASFNAPNASAIGDLLVSQGESVMLACTSCAEEMERKMTEEIERQKQEEERKKEEEEAKKREEETRRREEEEAKKREEEEEAAKREEEEEARRREEEEEAAKRREEEKARRREEEEAKKREEEEAKRREEEEGRKREGEEEARKREEEETKRREEEEGRETEGEEEARREAEEARRREEEEEGRRSERREEEEGRKTEGEEEARREAEEARRREEEEEGRRPEEEEARRREEEEAERREQEEAARRREEEEAAREEETRREQEEAAGGGGGRSEKDRGRGRNKERRRSEETGGTRAGSREKLRGIQCVDGER
ncbi:vicilin-like seed storage protein At2g18540 [Musa acuminata AAA Group]|uniref:vicilin-like seed storage protein At2g18540 n=1 Tax=Musa acuminata AAA Group TaxID=214697 RepID=UPI0031DD422D